MTMSRRYARLLAAGTACTVAAAGSALAPDRRTQVALSHTTPTRLLTPTAAFSAAATTEALRLTAGVRATLQYLGFRIPAGLDRCMASLLHVKSRLLAPSPRADPVLLHLALPPPSAPVHGLAPLRARLSARGAPVAALEVDLAAWAPVSLLARYAAHVVAGAESFRHYMRTRRALLPPEDADAAARMSDPDIEAFGELLRAVAAVADAAAAHGASLVLACRAPAHDPASAPARLAAAAIAGLLAHVYGPALPTYVEVGSEADVEALDALSGTMFEVDDEAGARVLVAGECGEHKAQLAGAVGLVSATCATMELLREHGPEECRVLYMDGVADLQTARLRALRCVPFVRREVLAVSAPEERRATCDIAMRLDSRCALAVEAGALWQVAGRKVLVGR